MRISRFMSVTDVRNYIMHHLYQLTHIDAANDLQITVFQNSGGNLDIAWVHLIMARHVEIAYPI